MFWKKLSVSIASAGLLAAALSAPVAASELVAASEHNAALRIAKEPIEGQYIVVLKDDVARLATERSNAPDVARVATDMARTHNLRVARSYSHVLRGFVATEVNDRQAKALMKDPRVAYLEEDGKVSINATQSNATWGLDRVDQTDLPLDGSYTYNTTASNVRTYIVDTGVLASHNDFGGRVISGFTSINDGRGSNDCNGHGTHVAGTVAGSTWGVAKQALIVPVRVLGCNGSGTNSGVIAGMDWIAANRVLPAVANMSLGGGASTTTDNAVANMRNAGVTVVVAAGNENQNACNVSPARAAAAITVGSTTSSDSRSSFSNFGSCVDIFAPGSSITSAWWTSNSSTNTISGTSMASPHVAGIAALYLAGNPSATPTQVENAIFSAGISNTLSNVGSGSPNLMAYSLFGGGGGGGTGPTELANGTPVGNLSGGQGSEIFFTLEVPAGATNLAFDMAGGSGDADLYVRYGAAPTTSAYDCRPYIGGNTESCDFATPAAGTWHVMIRGFSSYSGVSLVGGFTEPSGGGGGAPCTNCDQYTGALSGTGDSDVQPNGTYYFANSGTHNGYLRGPSSADFDLELYRWNGRGWSRVANSASASSDEDISYNGTRGYYYWRIRSYSGSGSYDFYLDRP